MNPNSFFTRKRGSPENKIPVPKFHISQKRRPLVTVLMFLTFTFLLTCIDGYFYRLSMPVKIMKTSNLLEDFASMIMRNPITTLILLTVFFFISMFLARKICSGKIRDKRGFKLDTAGAKGTGRFMTEEEKRRFFTLVDSKHPSGMILGKDKRTKELITIPWVHPHPELSPSNDNILVVGDSGSGKTSGILLGNIYNYLYDGISIMVTDPKGEIYSETYAAAKYMGYNIRILNLLGQFNTSDGWDVLKLIRESDNPQNAADLIATIFMDNTGDKGDSFWYDANINCLKLALLFVAKGEKFIPHTKPNSKGETRTLREVYDLITSEAMEKDISEAIQVSPHDKELIGSAFHIWSKHSQRESIQAGLGIRLNILQNKQLVRILSEDEINFRELNDKKTIIYVICSDKERTYKSILTLFTTFLFKEITDVADSNPKGKLDRKLMMVFEEFDNIGKIKDLSQKVSTLRSRNIGMLFCYQSMAQLMGTYGTREGNQYEWEIIESGCSIQVCLGSNDEKTNKYFSDRCGMMSVNTTIKTTKVATLSPIKWSPEESLRNQAEQRPVMMPDEVKRLGKREILITPAKNHAICEEKYFYKDHPMYQIRMANKDGVPVPCTYHSHKPDWYIQDLLDGNVRLTGAQTVTRADIDPESDTPVWFKDFSEYPAMPQPTNAAPGASRFREVAYNRTEQALIQKAWEDLTEFEETSDESAATENNEQPNQISFEDAFKDNAIY